MNRVHLVTTLVAVWAFSQIVKISDNSAQQIRTHISSASAHARPEIASKLRIAGDKHERYIAVTRSNSTATAPEEEYLVKDGKGGMEISEAVAGPDSDNDEFHLSPDKHWLFVVRSYAYAYNFGYLYDLSENGHVKPVHFGKLRLDEATRNFLFTQKHFKIYNNDSADHMVHFRQWSQDSKYLYFTVSDGPGFPVADNIFLIRYSLKNRTFRLLQHTYWPKISGRIRHSDKMHK